jgi:hypothetical protein
VLNKSFDNKTWRVSGEWMILHNGELHDLYSSSNIRKLIKLIRKREEGYVLSMRGGGGMHTTFWYKNNN